MYNSFQKDMDDTQPCVEVIKKTIFKGCTFGNLEKSKNDLLLMLDQYAGIDYIIKKPDNQMISIAGRNQWDKNWETFTIRKERHTGTKTEYDKRVEAIEKGYLYPTLTLQAYWSRDIKAFGAAIIPTKKLYDFIEWNPNKVYRRKSDNWFIYVYWTDLLDRDIIIYDGEELKKIESPTEPIQLDLFA